MSVMSPSPSDPAGPHEAGGTKDGGIQSGTLWVARCPGDRPGIIPTFGKVISGTPAPITDQFRCHDSLSAQKRKPNQP